MTRLLPQHRAERRARRLQLPLLLSLLLPRRPFRRQHHHQRKFSPLFISITPIQLQKSKLISPISISAPRTVHNNNHNQLLVLVLVDACRHSCWQRRAAAWQLRRSCNYRKQIPTNQHQSFIHLFIYSFSAKRCVCNIFSTRATTNPLDDGKRMTSSNPPVVQHLLDPQSPRSVVRPATEPLRPLASSRSSRRAWSCNTRRTHRRPTTLACFPHFRSPYSSHDRSGARTAAKS